MEGWCVTGRQPNTRPGRRQARTDLARFLLKYTSVHDHRHLRVVDPSERLPVDGSAALAWTPESKTPQQLDEEAMADAARELGGEVDLPEYADSLLAYHRSHVETLREIIGELPLSRGERVVDVATGDGTYALLLAERGADVVGVDISPSYIAFARARAAGRGVSLNVREGDAKRLPFPDDSLDGAFSAQSLYSIPDAPAVLAEMKRVVRPGGWVGVMENDSLHHVVVPWPPRLELELGRAHYQALDAKSSDVQNFYIGRRLISVMHDAGFVDVHEQSFAAQRSAPLSADEWLFLSHHLTALVKLAAPHLSDNDREEANALVTEGDPDCLLEGEDFSATILDLLVHARVE